MSITAEITFQDNEKVCLNVWANGDIGEHTVLKKGHPLFNKSDDEIIKYVKNLYLNHHKIKN